jgi:hypothetical protein
MSWYSYENTRLAIDRELAKIGDLEARTRLADYELVKIRERRVAQEKASEAAYAAPVHLGALETPPDAPPDAAPKPKRRPRNMSEGTARCIRVASGVFYSEGEQKRGGAAALAKRALERAAELGHQWSDELSPDTMREVAEALLLGIKDEDTVPNTKPR